MDKRESPRGLDTKILVAGAIGISPIPIAGEIGLSYFLYKLLDEQEALPKAVAIPAALLTRFVLYTELYIPIYKSTFE
jgi:hypothetical protein